jgi:hypothetical protein
MRTVCAVLLVLAAACGTPEPADAPDRATGLITSIGRGDDGSIESFTVRDGGESYRVLIDPGRDYGFDLEHLKEHRSTDWPVDVRLEQRGDELYALEILDA